MNNSSKYPEDDFNLEEFKEEFKENLKYNYYEKNKRKFSALFFLIMLASAIMAFLLYMLIQDYINSLIGIG